MDPLGDDLHMRDMDQDDEARRQENLGPVGYYNLNGLMDGEIPAGEPCPFFESCRVRIDRCPQPGNLKPHAYSCAAARLQSSLLEGK